VVGGWLPQRCGSFGVSGSLWRDTGAKPPVRCKECRRLRDVRGMPDAGITEDCRLAEGKWSDPYGFFSAGCLFPRKSRAASGAATLEDELSPENVQVKVELGRAKPRYKTPDVVSDVSLRGLKSVLPGCLQAVTIVTERTGPRRTTPATTHGSRRSRRPTIPTDCSRSRSPSDLVHGDVLDEFITGPGDDKGEPAGVEM
jgi:hypothetical protein